MLKFSQLSSVTLVGRILRSPLRLIPPEAIVRILQGPLRGHRWVAGSSNHGCWLGSYEADKQHWFIQIVKPGQTVYDLGANVGFYTLLASQLVGSTGHVIGFEPVPDNYHRVIQHLRLNSKANCQVLCAAVGRADGHEKFKFGANNSIGTLTPDGEIDVEVVSIDSLVRSKRLPPPDMMKIDIEGGEFDALRGAQEVLAQFQPTILLASHGAEVHRNCCDLLRNLGYQLKALSGGAVEDTDEILATPARDARPQ